jgi:cation:H+ antiporter
LDIAFAILGGLIVLVLGAEFLVRGSVRLAERAGVSPLLIGLTIVGFGTSTPELVTSVQAAMIGSPGIAVGNIVGSNIFNVLVILAIAAMIQPLAVAEGALRRDGVLVVATTLLFAAIAVVWSLDRIAGVLLLGGLAAYLVSAWRQERAAEAAGGPHGAAFDRAEAFEAADPALRPVAAPRGEAGGWIVPVAFAVGGLVLLVAGSRFLVGGAIDLARLLGVSETVIGLTIVAAGTSMPELATSALAAMRRQADVAIGNVLGSNIYNVLGIGGVTALIAPTAVPPEIIRFDLPVMVLVCVALLALLATGRRLSRGEGVVLFALYLGYLWWVWPA